MPQDLQITHTVTKTEDDAFINESIAAFGPRQTTDSFEKSWDWAELARRLPATRQGYNNLRAIASLCLGLEKRLHLGCGF